LTLYEYQNPCGIEGLMIAAASLPQSLLW